MTQEEPLFVVAAVLHRQNEILILRRGPGQSGAGFWEFPGGKVEVGESPEAALHREISEELGLKIRLGPLLGEERHDYPARKILLRVYWAEPLGEKLQLSEHDAFLWTLPEKIDLQSLSAADRPFVAKILQNFAQIKN